MSGQRLDYDAHAGAYAASRIPNPSVVFAIQRAAGLLPATRVLEIGTGTGNVLASLDESLARVGIDPSRGMLDLASRHRQLLLVQGFAEALPFAAESIDLAYSVDVIHHIADRARAAREVARVLRPGGRVLIATDSQEDIAARVPLSSHFPETIEIERRRYPAIEQIEAELSAAGLRIEPALHVDDIYPLTDIRGYESRAFSSLLYLSDEAHQRGLQRLRADLKRGPIDARSVYTIVVAVRGQEPGARSQEHAGA